MTHTTHPWTASWADNGIATLRDSEGKHFANFRNVRGDEISTVNADLAVVVAAPKMLAALRRIKIVMDGIVHPACRHPDDALSEVEAAIAEARGGAA